MGEKGKEERRGEEEGEEEERKRKRGREGERVREEEREGGEVRQERIGERGEKGSQEGREDIYSMRPHVWMPHSWVVSNILSVSDDCRTGGSKGVVYRGLTKPPSRI